MLKWQRTKRNCVELCKKVVKPIAYESEKVQIGIEEAEDLYRVIRIEHDLINETGEKVQLRPGADVDIVVEADCSATMKKPD